MDLLNVFSFTGLSILFINFILYVIGFAKNSRAYKFFVIYLGILFIIQVLTEIFAMKNMNNHFLATYYLFFPFALLSSFFFFLFKNVSAKKQKSVAYISTITLIGLIIQFVMQPELYFEFNSVGLLTVSCIITLYSVLYLFELISNKLPFHYVTMGIFIYFISSSLIFASATSIVSFNREISLFIWKINAGLFIIYQLLILWEWKQTFYQKQTKLDL